MHEENICCSRVPVHRDSSRGLYIPAFRTCNYDGTNNCANGRCNNRPDRECNLYPDGEFYTKSHGNPHTDPDTPAISYDNFQQRYENYAQHNGIYQGWRQSNLEER